MNKREEMKKSKEKFVEPNYNEKRKPLQKPKYPKSDKVKFDEAMGAFARMKLEEVMESVGGVHVENLQKFDVHARDLVKHRAEILNAMRSIIREGQVNGEFLGTAVAYASSLKFSELSEVIEGIAGDTKEAPSLRGLAIESLCRLNNKVSLRCIRNCIDDPNPFLREKAVKAIGIIGDKTDVNRLSKLIDAEEDFEVNRHILGSMKKLNPTLKIDQLKEKRRSRKLLEEASIVRPIGRQNAVQPQTMRAPEDIESFGGRDVVSEQLRSEIKAVDNNQLSYEYVKSGGKTTLLRIVSNGDKLVSDVKGVRIHSLNELEDIAEMSTDLLKVGRSIPLFTKGTIGVSKWVPASNPSPVVLSVTSIGKTVWRDDNFDLVIRFWSASMQRTPFMKVLVKMPNTAWEELVVEITEKEQQQGLKKISGFLSRVAGEAEIKVFLYSNSGGRGAYHEKLLVLPPNPISVNIVPQSRGANGEGPAHYNSAENRFYCHARCTFINGYPHAVTVNRTVTCSVTDGGNHVAAFSFEIGSFSVAANSSRTINLYTRHGSNSDVYDVFKGYGDVKMEFSFDTSEEDVSDWNVWAAMAQIKLALNYVGNISLADRRTIQSITENEASAILEQQSLYISETRRFVLPSNDSDWSRYRDIEMEDNKDSDCTSGSDEADDLRDDWSSPTDWLDVWIVQSFSGPACAAGINGFSPVNGPTSKGGDNSGFLLKRDGRDIDTDDGRTRMGRTIAHELGHFLGLRHHDDNTNFMFRTNGLTRTAITHQQFRKMAEHGFVERFIPGNIA
ncbi:MAG: HEAT repeat domain-containing protein [Lewinella sp.]